MAEFLDQDFIRQIEGSGILKAAAVKGHFA